MLLLIPFVFLALAAVVALRLPVGRDLAVVAFVLPWYAMRLEIGVGINPAAFVLFILAAKYLFTRQVKWHMPNGAIFLLLFYVTSIMAGIVSLMGLEEKYIFEGGEMRNGAVRFVVVLIAFSTILLPLILTNVVNDRRTGIYCVRAFILSMAILCGIGVLQFVWWSITNDDLFPVGSFKGMHLRTGMLQNEHVSLLRVSSLAGEPRNFGVSLVLGLYLVSALGQSVIPSKIRRSTISFVFLTLLVLTASSSALVIFVLGVTIRFLWSVIRRPFGKLFINVMLIMSSITIGAIFMWSVASSELVSTTAISADDQDITDIIKSRAIDRIEVEDFDHVLIKSLLAEPEILIIGRGFGMGHLFTKDFIPSGLDYMLESIISPKSGVVLLVIDAGILGMLTFVTFISQNMPYYPKRATPPSLRSGEFARLQGLAVFLGIGFLLRGELTEGMILFLAIIAMFESQSLQLGGSPFRRSAGTGLRPLNVFSAPPRQNRYRTSR